MVLKTVTLQEANGLLPLVKEHFLHLHVLLTHLQKLRAKLDKICKEHMTLDMSYDDIRVVVQREYGRRSRKRLKKLKYLETLIELELASLMRLGAVVKSLFPPHIDFLSLINNQPVLLCWHAGEQEITHWHYLDDGTPIRQDIATKERFGPEVVH